MNNDLTIIYRDLSELIPYDRNPRNNEAAVGPVAESIRQFGFKCPIIIDGNDVIVAGHTRLLAAKKLGLKKVPCVVADDLTEEQIKAFRLADNKVSELAEWNADLLGEELKEIADIDMSEFGFELSEFDVDTTDIQEDEVPDVPAESVCKLGDLWQLGDHRLICGDSTDANVIDRLMDGVKADLVFTDPPYGMKKESEGVLNDNLNYDDLLDFNRQWIPLTFGALKDNGSWYCWGIDEPLMDIYSNILKPMQKEKKITFRNLITWDKGNGQGQLSEEFRSYPIADEKCLFVMAGVQGFDTTQDHYYEGFEPIRLYLNDELRKIGVKPGPQFERILGSVNKSQNILSKSHFNLITRQDYEKLQAYAQGQAFKRDYDAFKRDYDEIKREYDEIKREWYETRAYFNNTHDNMNDVWHFDRAGKDEREHTGGHATPKPIALCSRAIKSSSREGEIVLDVFGGSGSTLIACEQLNRKCFMVELDPHYCDVIIQRWENFTGKKARLLNQNETMDL